MAQVKLTATARGLRPAIVKLSFGIAFITIADDRKASLGVISSAVFERGQSAISIGTGSDVKAHHA